MTRTIKFFVNGIATLPGSAKNWNARAVSWTHLNTDDRGQMDEYFTTALTVWLHEKERAWTFLSLLRQFSGWDIIIVAHSNGCHVTVDALNLGPDIKVKALHLVAGAVDGNFERNGLNSMLRQSRVGSVKVYRGGKDVAMRLCSTLAGKALFGVYAGDQPLGLTGSREVDPQVKERVADYLQPNFGHSTWWQPEYFDSTMMQF
jgi:pimeloyl-ACP methyl ester carboxylesterase